MHITCAQNAELHRNRRRPTTTTDNATKRTFRLHFESIYPLLPQGHHNNSRGNRQLWLYRRRSKTVQSALAFSTRSLAVTFSPTTPKPNALSTLHTHVGSEKMRPSIRLSQKDGCASTVILNSYVSSGMKSSWSGAPIDFEPVDKLSPLYSGM